MLRRGKTVLNPGHVEEDASPTKHLCFWGRQHSPRSSREGRKTVLKSGHVEEDVSPTKHLCFRDRHHSPRSPRLCHHRFPRGICFLSTSAKLPLLSKTY